MWTGEFPVLTKRKPERLPTVRHQRTATVYAVHLPTNYPHFWNLFCLSRPRKFSCQGQIIRLFLTLQGN
jgi:hypothetical protein